MDTTVIKKLIISRVEKLGISYGELIRLCGYSNEAKGIRRLERLFDADFISTTLLIERLPKALLIPKEELDAAINKTKVDIANLEEATWISAFKPHAHILTEKNGCPRQISLAAICNAATRLYIEFPEALSPEGYLDYVLQVLPDRLKEVESFYYDPMGFVINWTPGSATRYAIDGNLIEDLPKAYRCGSLSFCLS